MTIEHIDSSWAPPGALLTVTDVERLAKAGVKIEFADIKHQITADAQPVLAHEYWPRSLEDSFWDRWKRAHVPNTMNFGPMSAPFTINASQHGGKVYVFVSPGDQPPFILEDDAVLYPSDALMAKLALYEKSK